jgi:hypothetical protein
LFGENFHKDENRIRQWAAFQQKIKLTTGIDFETVMKTIKAELEPIYRRMAFR